MQNDHTKQENETRILVFDCWLPGFLYIKHMADIENISLTFVHNSESQLGQPAKEYEDFKANLSPPFWVKDFKSYNKDFKCLFETVKPHVVLVLSMHYVECRSALMFAKDFNVLRAYIPHGIFLLDRGKLITSRPTITSSIKRIIQKIPRAFYYTNLFWSSHFQRNPTKRGSFLNSLGCFRELLFQYSNWQFSPSETTLNYYADLVDVAIVYDKSIESHYRINSGSIFSNADFIISGTLDAGKILQELHSYDKSSSSILDSQRSAPVAYYISSPYPEDFSVDKAKLLANQLNKLKTVLKSSGYENLVYRPHPGEPNWFSEMVCALNDIERDTTLEVNGLIRSDLICGTSSSLLYIAIKLSKPIITVKSTRFKMDEPYYEPLISYPRITFDLDFDIESLLKNHEKTLRDTLIKHPTNIKPTLSDPVDELLKFVKRPHH